jgi:hypothetical protein
MTLSYSPSLQGDFGSYYVVRQAPSLKVRVPITDEERQRSEREYQEAITAWRRAYW